LALISTDHVVSCDHAVGCDHVDSNHVDSNLLQAIVVIHGIPMQHVVKLTLFEIMKALSSNIV
jgi:hypothetical protein